MLLLLFLLLVFWLKIEDPQGGVRGCLYLKWRGEGRVIIVVEEEEKEGEDHQQRGRERRQSCSSCGSA